MAELKDLLDERRKMVDKKATQHREIRDDWNEKTKEYTGTCLLYTSDAADD